jgi:hypothetical protein
MARELRAYNRPTAIGNGVAISPNTCFKIGSFDLSQKLKRVSPGVKRGEPLKYTLIKSRKITIMRSVRNTPCAYSYLLSRSMHDLLTLLKPTLYENINVAKNNKAKTDE